MKPKRKIHEVVVSEDLLYTAYLNEMDQSLDRLNNLLDNINLCYNCKDRKSKVM